LEFGPNAGLHSALARGLASDAAARREQAAIAAERLRRDVESEAAMQRRAAQMVAALEAEARTLEQRAADAARQAKAARSAAAAAERRRSAAAKAAPTPAPPKGASAAERRALAKVLSGGGEVVRRFGERTGAGGPASGLRVRAAAQARVLAPMAGRVIHTGVLEGSGHALILEVDGGNVLAFSGVGPAAVARGDRVPAGASLAAAANLAHGAVYVEVRASGRSIDPLAWLAAGR
jgi:septal ring factor EnvC (AmiA/AmiB activator)